MATDWNGSDAWFLESVALAEARGRADLSTVIETGDFANHAIFNPEEIEQAVGRLRSAGLLTVADDHFALTNEASDLWRQSPSQYSLERMRWLETVLKDRCEFDAAAAWSLDRRAWDTALSAYKTRFSAILQRLNKDEPGPDR